MEARSLSPVQDFDDLDDDRKRRAAKMAEEDPQESRPALPVKKATGFERFLEEGLAQAGGRRASGSNRKAGAFYTNGWAKGLTRGQAIEKARSMYEKLPDAKRKKYEGEANMTDVRSQREVDDATNYRDQRNRALGLPTDGGAQPQTQLTPVNGPNGTTVYRPVQARSMTDQAPTPRVVPPEAQAPAAGQSTPTTPSQAPSGGGTPDPGKTFMAGTPAQHAYVPGAPVQESTGGTIDKQPIAPRKEPGIYSDGQRMVKGQDGKYVPEVSAPPAKSNNFSAAPPAGQNLARAFNLDGASGESGPKPPLAAQEKPFNLADYVGPVAADSYRQQATAEVEAKYAAKAPTGGTEPEPAKPPQPAQAPAQSPVQPAFANTAPAGYSITPGKTQSDSNPNAFSRTLSEIGANPNAVGDAVSATSDAVEAGKLKLAETGADVVVGAIKAKQKVGDTIEKAGKMGRTVVGAVKKKGRSLKKALEEDLDNL